MESGSQADIARALRQLHESETVDYKAGMAWDTHNRKACCEIVKDLLAFGNADGGLIIIGVEELGNHTFRLAGLTAAQLGSWESTKLGNFAHDYADPRVACHVDDYRSRPGRLVLVPHEMIKLRRKAEVPSHNIAGANVASSRVRIELDAYIH